MNPDKSPPEFVKNAGGGGQPHIKSYRSSARMRINGKGGRVIKCGFKIIKNDITNPCLPLPGISWHHLAFLALPSPDLLWPSLASPNSPLASPKSPWPFWPSMASPAFPLLLVQDAAHYYSPRGAIRMLRQAPPQGEAHDSQEPGQNIR